MKRRNFNKSILQRGGLMIEALAMLGLIAVVTPTMYKKSAERTMEVEDINTATTIRTISNAANDYVAANYSTLLGDMVKNSENTRTLQLSDLSTYLPYGFNVEKALYNYDGNNIKVSVARQGNNLTTLLLFPAKLSEENGIGQERTARIAALIGSSGGYTTGEKSARGIGGIWKLEGDDFTNNFGNADPNTYSIVTASADTISASAGNELDYTKYLQRGRDAGDGVDSLWKNTMRTDLYMGGPSSTEDLYQDATGPWSIRNIKSLIVGADNGPQVTDPDSGETSETGGYGLYIANSAANPNAYVHGSLEAGNGQLKADETNLQYGNITAADGTQEHGFNVDTAGNLSNLRNLNLASSIKTAAKDGWESIKIGALPTKNRYNTDNYVIQAHREAVQNGTTYGGTTGGHLSLLGEDIISLNGYEPEESPNNNLLLPEKVKILQNGWKRTAGPTSAEFDPIKYNTDVEAMPLFPVSVGANTKIDALLATRQLDTQRIRAAELSVGSENINDENKRLMANADNVVIRDLTDTDPNYAKAYAKFNNDSISIGLDQSVQDIDRDLNNDQHTDHRAQINLYEKDGKTQLELYGQNTGIRGDQRLEASAKSVLIQAVDTNGDYLYEDNDDADLTETLDNNTLLLRNREFEARIHDREFRIGERDSENVENDHDHRTLFHNGHVDLADANLKIIRNLDGQHRPVFSVRGNDDVEGQSFEGDDFSGAINDCFTRPDATANSEWEAKYDVAIHGALSVSPYGDTKPSTAVAPVANISVGRFNHHSGINIVTKKYNAGNLDQNIVANNYNLKGQQAHNILMIDQGATKDKNNNVTMSERETGNFLTSNRTDPGTIYMRKGYMEVHGERSVPTTTSTNGAFDGNGVIAASRFVANNPVSGSHGYKVPQLVNNQEYSDYEGSTTRYDTYMVNPAYTSVMHDIKLTTRGGARLSDILPDFINKGIYLVNNSYLEKGASNSLNMTTWKQEEFEQIPNNTSYTIGTNEAWASPFLGYVPAPQCPPGYGRVITLAPSSFQMGTAGQLQLYDSNPSNLYYVYPDKISSREMFENMASNSYHFESVPVEGTVETRVNGTLTPADNIDLSTAKYVLTAPTDGESYPTPVTIQQSTWLKTSTKELFSKTDSTYVQGWATYMGFLYLSDLYPNNLKNQKSAYPLTKNIYWNLFPVLNRTLEGYATVYCYFDRTSLYGGRKDHTEKPEGVDANLYDYIDEAEYLKGTSEPPASFEKGISEKYRKRLNDPNLKYNEVW